MARPSIILEIPEIKEIDKFIDFHINQQLENGIVINKEEAIKELFDSTSPKNSLIKQKDRKPLSRKHYLIFYNRISKTLSKRTDLKEDLNNLKNQLDQKFTQNEREKADKIFAVISAFKNTNWFLYELEKETIQKKTIQFQYVDSAGSCYFKIESIELNKVWAGSIKYLESDKLLIGSLINTSSSTPSEYTSFSFSINNDKIEPTLLFGHKTFQDPEDKYKLTTRPVIIESEKSSDSVSQKYIQKFLFDSRRNRLGSPTKIFDTKQSFIKWVTDKTNKSKLNKQIEGEYRVYYIRRKNRESIDELVYDEVLISKSESEEFKAIYKEIHQNEAVAYFKGIISENFSANSAFVLLDGAYTNEEVLIDKSPIFLTLSTPDARCKNIDTLVGIASGLKSISKAPVARLVLLVKKEKINDTKFSEKEVLNFFKKYENYLRVRVPHSFVISSFADLAHSKGI